MRIEEAAWDNTKKTNEEVAWGKTKMMAEEVVWNKTKMMAEEVAWNKTKTMDEEVVGTSVSLGTSLFIGKILTRLTRVEDVHGLVFELSGEGVSHFDLSPGKAAAEPSRASSKIVCFILLPLTTVSQFNWTGNFEQVIDCYKRREQCSRSERAAVVGIGGGRANQRLDASQTNGPR
jgi:hypothetical protein